VPTFELRTGVLVSLLVAPAIAATEAAEVAVDLLTTPPGRETVVRTPTGEPFAILLVNRAPSGLYRITSDLELAPGSPQPPSLRHVVEPQPPRESELGKLAISPECDEYQDRMHDLVRSVDEAEAEARTRAFLAKMDAKVCPRLDGLGRVTLERVRFRFGPDRSLQSNDTLRVTVERLDPQTRGVVREWRLVFKAGGPKYRWAHATEDEWLVAETSLDVAQMVVFAKTRKLADADALGFELEPPNAAPGTLGFKVSVRPEVDRPPVETVLSFADHAWSPATQATFASVLLQRLQLKAAASSRPSAVLDSLLDLRGTVIAGESLRVSRGLETSMLDPTLHEQAALVLGALGLREASGVFFDSRRTLCRMAAHLGLASALRAGRASSLEGQYAEALLLSLAGRETDALARTTALQAGRPSRSQAAWIRSLRMRNTGDWRLLDRPAAATLLERLEWYRAVNHALGGTRSLELLRATRAEEIPDWSWIALERGFAVEEGHEFAGGGDLGYQVDELVAVWREMTGAELGRGPKAIAAALNDAPGRGIAVESGTAVPRVIDRGTWAYFHQRHLSHHAQAAESFLATSLGVKESAAEARATLTAAFDGLRLFPFLATAWEARGLLPGRGAYCDRMVSEVQQRPEVVTIENWSVADRHCPRARDTEALPPPERWFATVIPFGSAYDTPNRLKVRPLLRRVDRRRTGELGVIAPYDRAVLQHRMDAELGFEPAVDGVRQIYAPVLDYNVAAMRRVARAMKDDVEGYSKAYERIAALTPDAYLDLGDYLADRDRDPDAARAYALGMEKATDRVAASQNAEWLVNYYFDGGRLEEAMRVASDAASVGSDGGLRTLGRLMERMARYDEAVDLYEKIADRYDNRSVLDEFYVRYERRVGGSRYRAEAERARSAIFPEGLSRVTLADFQQSKPPAPTDGLGMGPFPLTDKLKRFGLRPHDVVVALDGYRVRNEAQYLCVRSFSDEPDMTAIVWRDGAYVSVKGVFKRRRFGPAPQTL
jgi:hypothetical protein